MKKVLIALSLLAVTSTAMAQHHHGFRHHGHHRSPHIGWWVAPVVVGAIGYELGRQQVIVQQPPVVIQQPIQTVATCTDWKEIQTTDGKVYRERTCTQ
jgi:uncharacterized protein YdeI (BOF family)